MEGRCRREGSDVFGTHGPTLDRRGRPVAPHAGAAGAGPGAPPPPLAPPRGAAYSAGAMGVLDRIGHTPLFLADGVRADRYVSVGLETQACDDATCPLRIACGARAAGMLRG